MATKTVSVRRNVDGTYTVRVGRHVEHVSTHAREKGEVFDSVKYAIISKDVYIRDADLVELMREAQR